MKNSTPTSGHVETGPFTSSISPSTPNNTALPCEDKNEAAAETDESFAPVFVAKAEKEKAKGEVKMPAIVQRQLGLVNQKKSRKRVLFFAVLAALFLVGWWAFRDAPKANSTVVEKVADVSPSRQEPIAKVAIKKPKEQQHFTTKETDNKEATYRKNWRKYITATNSNYAYGVLGGINDLSVVIKNRTPYPLDEVTAKVTIIKANGKPWKSQYITFYNVPAKSEKIQKLSKMNRGKSVQVDIEKLVSRKMQLIYNG